MVKQTIVYPIMEYHSIIKMKGNIDACNNLDEFKNYAEQKKLIS